MENENISTWCIYKITSPSGRVYIGRTKDLNKRILRYSGLHCKSQKMLYKSFLKHGFDSHVISVVEIINKEIYSIHSREMFWIDYYKSNISRHPDSNGLNLTDGGEGSAGMKLSDETKKKLSDHFKKFPNITMLGKKFSESTRLKMSKSRKGEARRKRAIIHYSLNGEVLGNYESVLGACPNVGLTKKMIHLYLNNKVKRPKHIFKYAA